jgi:hypothetical protein
MGQCRAEIIIRVLTPFRDDGSVYLFPMTILFRSAHILFLAALVLLLSSCEKDKSGPLDSNLFLPALSSAAIALPSVNLDTTTGSGLTHLPDGSYRITETVSGRVSFASGVTNLKGVYVRVYRPGADRSSTSGTLHRDSIGMSGEGYFSGTVSFTLTRAEAGLFRIEVYAQTLDGSTSNAMFLPLRVTRNNSAPLISSVTVPDTVTLPVGDSLLIRMTMAVSDSDGAGDIAGAFFYSLNSSDPTRQFILADDGNATGFSGDQVSGDGIYTITVKLLDQGNVRRTFQFEFHAVDFQGADSVPVIKYLTVN